MNSQLFAGTESGPSSNIQVKDESPEAPEVVRFDLDFPGGSPRELIDALGEASGTPVNAYIPPPGEAYRMPRLKYHNVTVPEVLFNLQGQQSIQLGNGRPDFLNFHWSFSNNIWTMVAEPIDVATESYNVVRAFSVKDLLEAYSIDAITTTIDSAWNMSGASEENEILFHPETKILLVKCSRKDMEVMFNVLDTLIEAEKDSPEPRHDAQRPPRVITR